MYSSMELIPSTSDNKTDEHSQIKSNAVVKYSAIQSPAIYAQLQCNTDLNLPPSNWLSNSANSYGLQHVLSQSTGFSSFRMAHMFPDCVGEVDVVSDAENIKNLLKIPYSSNQVSMIVHRIENTLLLDEFDIYKHLLKTAEKEWEWLKKFCYKHIQESKPDRNLYIQNKKRNILQQKNLVSKFLYHSLVQSHDENGDYTEIQSEEPEIFQISGPALPEPNIDEGVPDPTSSHKYNRNVVWTFEDIQMLLGTDMPIFGGTTRPCISLRLRDASRPISVLTGIDYWLDNLMSNVPEVVMCYHLNGIVQKYEIVKTEELPNLEGSKFVPEDIRDIAQHILSFLKSNATKAGHTYWLFKGKGEDIVKLYDLSSVCADNVGDNDQNPFTIPVAMLLYRVARNMKHNTGRNQPGTIRMLLKNCILLLPKEKYPQIVTSSHYMISDLYVPAHTDPAAPGLDQMETDDMDSYYEDDMDENEINSWYMKELDLSSKKMTNYNTSYKSPPPISGTLVERCTAALHHVVEGLKYLQFFPLQDEDTEELKRKVEKARKREEEDNPTMAKPYQAIPMPYGKIHEDNITKKKKNKKRNKNKNEANINMNNSPTALLPKPNAEAIPTWQEPDKSDNASWKAHLKTLLYEKACLIFAILAEQDFVIFNYGSTLRNIEMLIQCQQVLQILKYTSRAVQESCFLGRAGDACFMIVQNWKRIDEYQEQISKTSETYLKLLEEILKENENSCDSEKGDESHKQNSEYPEENKYKDITRWSGIIPRKIESLEQMLLASCKCYEKALSADPIQDINAHYRRLGNIQNELGVFYMNKANEKRDNFEDFYTNSEYYLQNGIKSFEAVKDDANLALLHSNMGRLMRLCAHFHSPDASGKHKLKGKEKFYYNKALESYQKALQILGNRRSNPGVWDTVCWELSTALYTRAIIIQDDAPNGLDESKAEREVIETLQKALQYCDMETPSHRQPIYQYRGANIHQRLATLYQYNFRRLPSEHPRRKSVLQLCKMHYERAYKLFKSLEQHMELLKIILERIALNEVLVKTTTNVVNKIKYLQHDLYLLTDTSVSFSWLLQTSDKGHEYSNNNETSASDTSFEKCSDQESDVFESQAINFVGAATAQLQYALRMLAKLCLTKSSIKDCDKLADIYKSLYSASLNITCPGDWRKTLKKFFAVISSIQSSTFKLTSEES